MDRAAKSAPEHERLTGSVAPKGKQMKANLGWARFVHQKASDRDGAVKGAVEVNGEGVG